MTLLRRIAPHNQLWTDGDIQGAVEVDLELIAEVRPDLVVGDLRPSVSISAALMRVPSVMITNAYWTDDLAAGWRQPAPESSLLRPYMPGVTGAVFAVAEPTVRWLASRPIDAVRRRHGLRPYGARWSTLHRADHLALADHPDLFRLRRRPSNHHFVGPALWSPPGSLPVWWDELRDDLPVVYVGIGSSGKIRLLPAIVEGLASLPVQVAVATGGLPAPSVLPKNVWAAPYLPGDVVARRSAVVITNGGSASLYQAWNEGVPVLGIPWNFDQHRGIAAMAWRGACLSIRSDRISPAAVAGAVRRLLSEPSFGRAARQIASAFAELRVADTFPVAVASILGDRLD